MSKLMARQQVPPLRIQKGGNASPNKLPQVTSRPLSDLSPMALRRNSPSFPQAKVEYSELHEATSADMLRPTHSRKDLLQATHRRLATLLTRSGAEGTSTLLLPGRTTIPLMSSLRLLLRSDRRSRTSKRLRALRTAACSLGSRQTTTTPLVLASLMDGQVQIDPRCCKALS